MVAIFLCYSFPSSVKTENILSGEEYGNAGGPTTVLQRYLKKVHFFLLEYLKTFIEDS
jgi:hypothetical protein